MDKHGWTDKRTHPPTETDMDPWRCVLAWHDFQGPMITSIREVMDNRYISYWKRTPGPPDEYMAQYARIGGRTDEEEPGQGL